MKEIFWKIIMSFIVFGLFTVVLVIINKYPYFVSYTAGP